MRNIDTVLNDILAVIPSGEPVADRMRYEITLIQQSVPYTAPEAVQLLWQRLVKVFTDFMPRLSATDPTLTQLWEVQATGLLMDQDPLQIAKQYAEGELYWKMQTESGGEQNGHGD